MVRAMISERVQLFLASFLMLFTELVLIRWAGAYVVYLSYFANFILLGSFLGIGVGFLRAHKPPNLFRWAPFLLLLFVGVVIAFPVTIDRAGGDLVYFGFQEKGFPAWAMLPFIFLATAATMAAIAHGVAVRFVRFSALDAYRLDILGSIAGIVAFSALAFAGLGPVSWGVVVAILVALLLPRLSWLQLIACGALVVVFGVGTYAGGTIWSPYYRLKLLPTGDISANGVPHQVAQLTAGTDYEIPYDHIVHTPGRVLVIGAGSGNDVAVALRMGAQDVDAVEIDPKILETGLTFHPEHPYLDPRVTPIVDDGRAFLDRTNATYDLIVFALPDSLTLVTGQSAVRLESYLFTREAFVAARDHLAPGGVFAMYNYYREQWLADRLAGTLNDVFGGPPCLDLGTDNTNDVGRKSIFVDSVDRSAISCNATWTPDGRAVVGPATDDRPFLYLRSPSIPLRYAAALLFVLLASAIVVRFAGGAFRTMSSYLDLFFMGAAFLLLETKSVVQFALLFGTTWFVNALVFAGVLGVVLLAIEVERRMRIGRRRLLFAALFASLFISWLVPPDVLLGLALLPRFLAAVGLTFSPIFIANLIFAERFRDTADPAAAFGANLLGAMIGGTLEYASLLIGFRALLLLVSGLYVLAYVASPRADVAPSRSSDSATLAQVRATS
jgi:hypothetical protein